MGGMGRLKGEKVFNVPVALSLMVFFALCCQCASTLAVIRRETRHLALARHLLRLHDGAGLSRGVGVYQVGRLWL